MSYATDTILTRDKPQGNEFDKLRIVGPSPIKTQAVAAEWGGAVDSDLYIVVPEGDPKKFCANEIAPISALNKDYTVTYEPDPLPTHLESQPPARATRLLSPEEQFRLQAKTGDKKKTGRQRTQIGATDE